MGFAILNLYLNDSTTVKKNTWQFRSNRPRNLRILSCWKISWPVRNPNLFCVGGKSNFNKVKALRLSSVYPHLYLYYKASTWTSHYLSVMSLLPSTFSESLYLVISSLISLLGLLSPRSYFYCPFCSSTNQLDGTSSDEFARFQTMGLLALSGNGLILGNWSYYQVEQVENAAGVIDTFGYRVRNWICCWEVGTTEES